MSRYMSYNKKKFSKNRLKYNLVKVVVTVTFFNVYSVLVSYETDTCNVIFEVIQ